MYILFGLIILFVALDASADATRDDKKKISHLLQALFVLCALFIAIFYEGKDWISHLIFILWYAVNRFFLFDIVYNKVRGLYVDYIGTTSWWDIITYKILVKLRMPPMISTFIKFVIWFAVNGAILHPNGVLHNFLI